MAINSDYFKVEDNPINKNTIEDILAEDEQILQRLTPNRRVFVLESIFKGLPIALIWVAFDAFFIFMMVRNGVFGQVPFMVPFVIVFFAFHLIPLWAYIANVVKKVGGYKNIEYAFTDKRIIIRSGLVGIDFKYFYYQDISSVTVKVGIFDRMFKVGDLYLSSNGQAATLDDIDHPYEYSSKIQKIITDIKTDMAYPNDLRPEENHGYRTKYKG